MNSMGNNNELYHYGVKGMKWGVRRFGQKQIDKYTEKAAKYALKSRLSQGRYPMGINIDDARARSYAEAANYAQKAIGRGIGVERYTAAYNKQATKIRNKQLNTVEKIADKQLKIERDVERGKISTVDASIRTQKLLDDLKKTGIKSDKAQTKIDEGRRWLDEHPDLANARWTGTYAGGMIGGIAGGAIGGTVGSLAGYTVGNAYGKHVEKKRQK